MGRITSVCGLGFLAAFGALSATGSGHAEDAKPAAMPPRPPLEAYGKLPAIEDVAISPSGTHIALITTLGDARSLVDYDVATQKAVAMSLSSVKPRAIFWASDTRVVIETSSTASLPEFLASTAEYFQASSIDVAHGDVSTLFRRRPDHYYPIIIGHISRAVVGGVPTLFTPNIELSGNGPRNLFALDPATGAAHLVVQGNPNCRDWVVAPDGQVVARSEYDDADHTWRLKFHTADGGWDTVYSFQSATETPYLYQGLGRDGVSVVVRTRSKTGAWDVFEISPNGHMSEPLEPEGETRSPIFHPKTARLIGFGGTLSDAKSVYFDPEFIRLQSLTAKTTPGLREHVADFAEDPNKLVLYAEGKGNPGAYYFIDYHKGKVIEVGETYPDAPSEWVAEQKPITYAAADGLTINGYLTLPPGRDPKNLPLIVLPHGGPWAHDRPGFDWWAQALASRGYVVLQPNYRGSTGYGEAFEQAGRGEFGKKMQTDLSDGVRALAKQGLINPKRVCIVGASYGGYAALAGATLDPGVYACAASVAGVSDLGRFMAWKDANHGGDSLDFNGWSDYLGPREGWDAVSPLRHVKAVQIPVLLVHGRDDTVVPDEQSTLMQAALQREGKTVEFVELKGEDHWLSKSATRLQMLNAVVAFVEKYNPAD